MPIQGVPEAANPNSASTPPPVDKSVDKDSFLKLLVTQMQNQDPLSPMEGTEFVSQLAQFTNVEQAMRQNDALELISLQLTGIASNEAVTLIGKEVTVRGSTISFDGNTPTGFSANLNEDAAEVTVTIRDQNGNAVCTVELGEQGRGTVTVPWDGRDENGRFVPPGSYSVEVSALDAEGNPVTVENDVTGKVVGVSFEKGYPELLLDSGATAPISDLVRVDEGDGSTSSTTSQAPLPVGALQDTISEITAEE